MAFTSLEEKLVRTEATVEDQGQRIASVETSANTLEQRIHMLEKKCAVLADSNTKRAAQGGDLEGQSQRNNIRIIGLPESIEAL